MRLQLIKQNASVDTLTSNTARTDDDIQSLLDDAESQIQGYLDEYRPASRTLTIR